MNKFEKGWAEKPLEGLTSLIKDGTHGSHKDIEGGVPLLSAKDVRNGTLSMPNDCRRISKFDYNSIHKNYRILKDDILLTVVGTIGRCCLINGTEPQFSIQRSIAVIRPSLIDPRFLFQYFHSDLFQKNLRNNTNASAQGGVYLGSLAKCTIIYPSLDSEQLKIAEVLETVDKAIEQTKALLAKQERIKIGLMQDLLTKGIDENGNHRSEETHEFKDSIIGRVPVEWEICKIEQKLKAIIDYRGRTPKKVESGIPLITAKNVRDGYLDVFPHEYIDEKNYYTWMTRGIPKPGDVLFTTEAPMGNVAKVPRYKIALAQRLLTLSVKPDKLLNDYLYWILHWKKTRDRIALLTSGSTVLGVKQSVFRKIILPFPCIKEQSRISNALNSQIKLQKIELDNLKKLELLKTALIQDLLSGKKRVTPLL